MKAVSLNANEYVLYQKIYLDLVNDEPIIASLEKSFGDFVAFYEGIDIEKMNYAYKKHKWTIKEVVLHMIDTERIFQYRALRFAREDKTMLSGFSENEYVVHSNSSSRSKESLLAEFKAVRMSTIALYESFNTATLMELGNSSGSTMSVRGLGYLISGHQIHHTNIIKERYLG
jgi:hypothetical protein